MLQMGAPKHADGLCMPGACALGAKWVVWYGSIWCSADKRGEYSTIGNIVLA